jgi:predicted PurR-regulated permease PerM
MSLRMPYRKRTTRTSRIVTISERNERVLFVLSIFGVVILGGFIAYKILEFLSSVPIFTFVLIGAIFFSYLIHPLVAWLNRRMSIAASLLIVYAGIAVVLAFVVYILSPLIAHDAQSITANTPRLVTAVQNLLTNAKDPLTAHLPPSFRAYLHNAPVEIERVLTEYAASLARQIVPLFFSLIAVLAMFIVIPITAAYMTSEARSIRRGLLAMLPPAARLRAARIIVDLDVVVGGFIRGQILVAITIGFLITLLLVGLRVPDAVLIGTFAGVVDIVPYVGAIAGWLPAFLISYNTNGIGNAIAVSIGIIVINQLEGHIIAPNIVSRTVALTPLGVLLALLLVGEVLGPPGLLIAIPAASVARVLIINFMGLPRHGRAHLVAQRPLPNLPRLLLRLIVRDH